MAHGSLEERAKKLEKLFLTPELYHIDSIMQGAKNAYLSGDKGMAAALLAKGSQFCEDQGLIDDSVRMLALAERLFDE